APATDVAPTPGPSAAPADSSFRYFRSPTSAQQPRPNLDDKYFEPTVADVRAQQTSLSARRDALQNAPLRTSAMRKADDDKRRARWPNTTIRIKFTDGTALERTFPSTDKIRAVYAFVRGSLREDARPHKFVLSDQPPKDELKVSDPKVRDLSLSELGLAPSSVLLIKFVDEEFNHPGVSPPLDPSVLAAIEDYPTPPSFDSTPPSSSDGKTLGGSKGGSKMPGLGALMKDGEVKVPKWMKLGPSE
ncbi:uncharacterized protein BXZ73DRAFT_3856, partial [Epithele typhae]|uniref:uncharacterized protein n=1 Tax=Epithele typhae TaxID=378194 RepID=UPI0020081F00